MTKMGNGFSCESQRFLRFPIAFPPQMRQLVIELGLQALLSLVD